MILHQTILLTQTLKTIKKNKPNRKFNNSIQLLKKSQYGLILRDKINLRQNILLYLSHYVFFIFEKKSENGPILNFKNQAFLPKLPALV
jgi:hypothetical protein